MLLGNCKASIASIPLQRLLLFCLLCLVFVGTNALTAEAATVVTDTTDYPPGSTVTILGEGFWPGETVTLQVVHADGDPLDGEGHDPWNVTASGSGDFTAYWDVPWDDNLNELLLLTADGQSSTEHAEATFWDKIGGNLDQFQNTNLEWANGNINGSNSCYAEGDIVPYRYFLTGVPGGTTHTFIISFEATKAGIHAIDYLAQYDLSEAAAIALLTDGACSNTSTPSEPGCVNTASLSAVAAIPDPTAPGNYVLGDPPANVSAILSTNAPAFLIDGPGDLYAYNASSVSFGQYYYSGSASDRELNVVVTFTAIANGDVGFFWGGHLARGISDGWGIGMGAASVSGAPYHMRAGSIDGGGGAAQDRSIQNGVICLPPDATISCAPTADHCTGGTYSCSVPAYAGSGTGSYTWTATGATITSGQGTENITYTITASVGQTVTISVEACEAGGGCPGDFCCNTDEIEFVVDQCCDVTISCPADATIECDESTLPANTGTATFSTSGSSCPTLSVTYSDSEVAGACPQEKVVTRTWQVVDGSSNVYDQCVQTITVQDTQAPTLAGCPADVTVECDAVPAAATVTASDNCDTNVPVTFSENTTPGICADSYTITRTWTATDDCGNQASCSQTITVQDTQAPTLAGCPADDNVECDAVPAAATVTASDNCDPNPTVVYGEVRTDGPCEDEYTLTRTWTATDRCGNQASCSQTITVQDTQVPTLAGCPADVSVSCDAIPAAATVTATDNCDPSVSVIFSENTTPGACAHSYTITRTWTATDRCGNQASCSQTITVTDSQAPTLAGCPADISLACGDPLPAAANVTATDNCDPNPSVTFTESTVPGNCAGNYEVVRTWTATDDCGNDASCTQTITYTDTDAPTVTCPADVQVMCYEDVPAPNPGSVTASDACDPNPTVVFVSDVESGGCPKTITRTYRATDACGNSADCTQTITVNDQTPPTLAGCPADVTISCDDAVPAPANVTASDNCGAGATLDYTETSAAGSCPQEYVLTRTWTATDGCGNQTSCSQTITVVDDTDPYFTTACPTDVTVTCYEIPDPPTMAADDNCDTDVTVTFNETSGTPLPCPYPYDITRTWTATDDCGNSVTCTQVITVVDETAPMLVGCPTDLQLSCEEAIPDPASVTAIDACDPAPTVTFEETETAGACANEKTITRTWTATDACGNSDFCTQTITITDDVAPVCNVPADQTIELCTSEEVCLPVSCTDNCDPNPTMTLIAGPGAIVGGNWCYTPTQDEVVVFQIQCQDACGNTCTSTISITFDINLPPTTTCAPAAFLTVCDLQTPICLTGFTCDDPDGNLVSCEVSNGTLNGDEVCFTPVEGPNTIILTATDDCGVVSTCTTTVNVTLNSPPSCGAIADINEFQCEPTEICATLTVTDVNNNLDYCELVSGPGTLNGMDWCWTPDASGSFDVTIRCYDECGEFCETTFNVTVDLNDTPVISCPDDASIFFGQSYNGTATATDADDGQNYTFSLGAGSPGTIDPNTGAYSFQGTGEFICENTITVIVTDECNAADTCSFVICVENKPPVIACPDPITVCIGEPVTGQVVASDPDNGPSGLLYEIASFDGPGTVDLNPSTGEFVWNTDVEPEYAGTFELCIIASDGAPTCDPCSPQNADTCCVSITVVPAYALTIEKVHNAIQGQIWPVSLYLDEQFPIYPMGGFNILIEYDASALSLIDVLPGEFIHECGWEYFTYRYGASGNCGASACPSGKLRITAIAETNNGSNHPACFTSDVTGELAQMNFLVTNDRTFECQYVPIRFCWYDCRDNAYSSVSGDTLFVSRHVYDYVNTTPIHDPSRDFPTLTGANYTCDVALEDGKPDPLRCADFFNGGIDIVCADSIDARGDINLNEVAYEIADAVLFGRYFVYGLSVFTKNQDGQIAASDVNADGIVLSIADFVYTVRVIVGDAPPYPKINPVPVDLRVTNNIYSVDEYMGAALFTFDGQVSPNLIADQMDMMVNYDGETTRLLIYSLEQGVGFEGEFLSVDGELLSVEMATYDGAPAKTGTLPADYTLNQNYPNPFNPSTILSFNLPVASDYLLTIYNVQGQVLKTFSGHANAGETSVEWNAGDHQASGVYFYRLEAGSFSTTRKMILLK